MYSRKSDDHKDGVSDAYKLSSVPWQKKSYQACHTGFELPLCSRTLQTTLNLRIVEMISTGSVDLNHKLIVVEKSVLE